MHDSHEVQADVKNHCKQLGSSLGDAVPSVQLPSHIFLLLIVCIAYSLHIHTSRLFLIHRWLLI